MSEWKVQVPVKLDTEIVDRLDLDVKRFAPFFDEGGRSAMIRTILAYHYAAVDEGILKWGLEPIQEVLGKSSRQSVPSAAPNPAPAVIRRPK